MCRGELSSEKQKRCGKCVRRFLPSFSVKRRGETLPDLQDSVNGTYTIKRELDALVAFLSGLPGRANHAFHGISQAASPRKLHSSHKVHKAFFLQAVGSVKVQPWILSHQPSKSQVDQTSCILYMPTVDCLRLCDTSASLHVRERTRLSFRGS